MRRLRWKLNINKILIALGLLVGLFVAIWWLFEQPGIPDFEPEDTKAFSIAFWSALYAGILASLPTGLIVGFFVWWAQERVEKRRVRREYEREVALLQERIRPVLNQENPIIISTAVGSESPPVQAIIALLIDQPIELWRANLPSPNPFLDAIKELQKVHSDFITTARKLDFYLKQFIRAYHASKDIDSINDQERHFFCVGRIQGVSPEAIVPWIDMPNSAIPQLEEVFTTATAESAVQEQIKLYLGARTRVLEKLEVLARILNMV